MLAGPWSLSVSLISACVAAFTDLRTRTIPNWLTLPVLAVALLVHGVLLGTDGILVAALGAVLCFVPSYFLFTRGALGGGDVKLFAALGALLGPREGLELELTAFMLMAGFALWSSAWHGQLGALLRASWRATLHLFWPSRFAPSVPSGFSHEAPMGGAILVAVIALCVRSLL
jgi:prepilin peptidase CpaA